MEPARRRRAVALGLAAACALAALPARRARAHPLLQGVGTQSIFYLFPDRVRIRFNLGFSPQLSFQVMQAADRNLDDFIDATERDAFVDDQGPRLLRGIEVTVDGRPLTLAIVEKSGDTFYGEVGFYASDLWYTFEAKFPPSGADAVHRLEYTEANFPNQRAKQIAWIPLADQGEGLRFRVLEPEASSEVDAVRANGRRIVLIFSFSPKWFPGGAAAAGPAPPPAIRPEVHLEGILGEGGGKACLLILPPSGIRVYAAISLVDDAAGAIRRRGDTDGDGRIGGAEEEALSRALGAEVARAVTARYGDEEIPFEITRSRSVQMADFAEPLRITWQLDGRRPEIPRGERRQLLVRLAPLPGTGEPPDIWIPLRGNDPGISWTVLRPQPEIGTELVRGRGGSMTLEIARLGPPTAPPAAAEAGGARVPEGGSPGAGASPKARPAWAKGAGARGERKVPEGSFQALFSRYLRGKVGFGIFLVFCLLYGMSHALTPGHGKALVAAYLIGTRGRIRDAVTLGITATITHTAVVYAFAFLGVWALGITATASTGYINEVTVGMQILSGLLIAGMGIYIFRRFGRGRAHPHPHSHPRAHDPRHAHPHGDVHEDAHEPAARPHPDGASRAYRPRLRELLGFGITGGAIPCPTLLVILIVLLNQYSTLPDKRVVFFPLLAFSVGLGGVLTAIGVSLVATKRAVAGGGGGEVRWISRLPLARRVLGARRAEALDRLALRLLPRLPRVSAVIITALGALLIYDAFRRGSFEIATMLRRLADRIAPSS